MPVSLYGSGVLDYKNKDIVERLKFFEIYSVKKLYYIIYVYDLLRKGKVPVISLYILGWFHSGRNFSLAQKMKLFIYCTII